MRGGACRNDPAIRHLTTTNLMELPIWLTQSPVPMPLDSEQLKHHLLDEWQAAHGGTVWQTLDDVRTCLRCRRSFKGRDVQVERGRFSKPPDYDLICPTPKCFASPADWTSRDENSSVAHRSVGDEGRGMFGREFWFRPRYRNDQQEDALRMVLWDQRPRRNAPLWAHPNPHLTREIVTRCNREVGFVIYTHDNGMTEGVWHPKDPNRPESLRQAPMPHFHPVTRIEAVGSYYRRRLREFFIVTVELKMLPQVAAKVAAASPGMEKFVTKMQSREAGLAAQQAIEDSMLSHLATSARNVDLNGFTWTTEIRQRAGWHPPEDHFI